MDYFKLNPNKILEKDFKVTAHGYDPIEVDQFLDKIISDYQIFYHFIEELDKQNLASLKLTEDLKKKIRELESKITILEDKQNKITSYDNYSNLDLLKKIAVLEEKIYNQERQNKKIH